MSTLTKIAIVVLMVLVLFACPVFIQQAVTPYKWKAAYFEQKDRAEVNEAQAQNNLYAFQVMQNLYEKEKERNSSTVSSMQTLLDMKTADIARLGQQLADRSAQMTALNASVTALEKDMEKLVALNKEQGTQLADARNRNIELNDQIRRAQDQINKYLAQLEETTRAIRVLKEQVAQKEGELTELREQLAQKEATGGAVSSAKAAPKAPKIDATITAVRNDVASLNVGSASGVQKGMEFIIYRGANFVGHLRVAEVDAASCAGVIVNPIREVKQGDKATTNLE